MKTENNLSQENKFSRFYKENKYILLSALVAFLITQIIAYCYDLIPYGNMTILRMDLYHQYGPLFAELYDRLTSGESLIYSWNSGLGSSFLGNFFNYLSSPLTIIILLFGHKNITEAISCLIMLKAILSSASFTYYLKKSLNQSNFITAGFGVLYAFSGYFVAYYWNLMWLDAMVLFPIVLLGIERIINKGKPMLYCLSLAVMMFANYYMAYMVCLFSVIYFFIYYFSKYSLTQKFDTLLDTKNVIKKLRNSLFLSSAVKFAVYSIAAALLASIALLPLLTILDGSSATSGTAPTKLTKYFAAFDFLANHLASVSPTIRSSGNDVLPNVYCGILTLILVPLFIISKKIPLKERIAYVVSLAIMYFSFNVNIFNYIWHGLHFPNDLPYRFSFMYSFLLLIMAFKAFSNLKEYSTKQILTVGIGLIFFMIFVEKVQSKNVGDISLLTSLAFAVGYVIILYLFKNKRFQASAVAILTLCTISSEIMLADTDNFTMNQSKENYTVDYDDFKILKKQLDELNGDDFYRMELTDLRTRMDPSWFDYNGISVFSSMAYERVANLMSDVGVYGNYINSYTYNPQTPVFNSFFDLKYIVDNNAYGLHGSAYTKLMRQNGFTAYQNNYYLPIAFFANSEIKDWDASQYDNPFNAQSELFRASSGISDVFNQYSFDESSVHTENLSDFVLNDYESGYYKFSKINDNQIASISFEIIPENYENAYIYIKSRSIDSVSISSDTLTRSYDSTDEGYILDIGQIAADEVISVDIILNDSDNSGVLEFYATALNQKNFEQGYNILSAGGMNVTKHNDTSIEGTLTAEKNGAVYTSIPYDDNWQVYVDGVKLDKEQKFKISNALLGFNISEGQHEIKLVYTSNGLFFGVLFSFNTVLILAIVLIVKKKRNKPSRWKELNNPTEVFVINHNDTQEQSIKEIQKDMLESVETAIDANLKEE